MLLENLVTFKQMYQPSFGLLQGRCILAGDRWNCFNQAVGNPLERPGRFSDKITTAMEYKMGGFTGYELWVVAMLCTGATPLEIAEKRGVIRASVNYTIRQIFRKTGFTRRSEIIEWARENSLDDPSILEMPHRRK